MFKFRLFFLINITLIVNIFPEVQINEIKKQPLNFGDVVMFTSSKFDRNLWVYSTGNKKQVLVGPNSDIRTKNGPQLFKIKSNVNKKGIVNYQCCQLKKVTYKISG